MFELQYEPESEQLMTTPGRDEDQRNVSYAPLRQFLLKMAWMFEGEFVLHGFCDSRKEVHEVTINVSLPHALRKRGCGQFDDLQFRVQINNEDTQRCSIIVNSIIIDTVSNNNDEDRITNSSSSRHARASDASFGNLPIQRISFLRVGIQLRDLGVALPLDHVVHESGECLGTTLEGEKHLDSANSTVLEASHRSRAMQLSPQMLAYLPRTRAGLHVFLSSNVGCRLPDLMRLFETPSITILGLSTRDFAFAKSVLQEASFTVTDMTIDDSSFATNFDAIKSAGSMSAISLIRLSILSSLTPDHITKLAVVTAGTSLRFLVDATRKNTMPLLIAAGSKHSYSAVRLFDRRVLPIDCSTTHGNAILDITDAVLAPSSFSNQWIPGLEKDCITCLNWAEKEIISLSLDKAHEQANVKRLVLVVYGDHPPPHVPSSTGTCKYFDLGRCSQPYDSIQGLLWAHKDSSLVIALYNLNASCFAKQLAFYDTEVKDVMVEPEIFRPDFVIQEAASKENWIAAALGCSVSELVGMHHFKRLRDILSDAKHVFRTVPTFEGFLNHMAFSELLSHRAQVSAYLYYIIVGGGDATSKLSSFHHTVDVVSEICQNSYTRRISDSVEQKQQQQQQRATTTMTTVPFTQLAPSYYVMLDRSSSISGHAPGDSSSSSAFWSSLDDAVLNSLCSDDNVASSHVLRDWLSQQPTPAALRVYITFSSAPLAVFLIDPVTTANLLTLTDDEKISVQNNVTPRWADRLADILDGNVASETMKCAGQANKSIARMISVVKWVVFTTGCGDVGQFTGEDLENLSSVGVTVDIGGSDFEAPPPGKQPVCSEVTVQSIALTLSLDSLSALHEQQQLLQFLVEPIAKGGGTPTELLRCVPGLNNESGMGLGVIFVHVLQNAKIGSALLQFREASHILSWRGHTSVQPTNLTDNRLVEVMTPAARAELLIMTTDESSRKWERLQQLLVQISPNVTTSRNAPEEIDEMIRWVVNKSDSSYRHHVAAALLIQRVRVYFQRSDAIPHSEGNAGDDLANMNDLDDEENAELDRRIAIFFQSSHEILLQKSAHPQERGAGDDGLANHTDDDLLPDPEFATTPNSSTLMWPLDPLDSTAEAQRHSDWLCNIFIQVLLQKMFYRNPDDDDDVQQQEPLNAPTPEAFTVTCHYIAIATSVASQQYAIEAIRKFMAAERSQRLSWVCAALSIVAPFDTSMMLFDETIILFLSEFVRFEGPLQQRFLLAVQENYETAPLLPLSLIGWLEFVPNTMLLALSRITGLWEAGRRHEIPVECQTSDDGISVLYVSRPLPDVHQNRLFQPGMMPWKERNNTHDDDAKTHSRLPQYFVSLGVNEGVIEKNLAYLNHAVIITTSGSSSMEEDGGQAPPSPRPPLDPALVLGVRLIMAWFEQLRLSTRDVTDLFEFGSSDVEALSTLTAFLNEAKASSRVPLEALHVKYVVVLDAHLKRDVNLARMMILTSGEGFRYTRSQLLAPFANVDNEEFFWDVFNEDKTEENFVKACSHISTLRFISMCDERRLQNSSSNNFFHELAVYANDMLLPCLALCEVGRNDLANLYIRHVSAVEGLSSEDRGSIALAAIAHRRMDFVCSMRESLAPIPEDVLETVNSYAYASSCNGMIGEDRYDQLRNWPVSGTRNAAVRGNERALSPRQQQLSLVVRPFDIRVCRSRTVKKASSAPPKNNERGDEAAVIFRVLRSETDRDDKRNIDHDEAFNEEEDDQQVGDDLSHKQFSGRSVDVSLILELKGSHHSDAFYLTLAVTPGAECHLVDHEGNLELSSDVRDRTVHARFKSHGQAWNYCKSIHGRVSLVGEGFFLYRSKESLCGWKFFVGHSVAQGKKTSSNDEPRVHFWHVAAYHVALCIPLPSALRSLLHLLCEAVYLELPPLPHQPHQPQLEGTQEERMSHILAHLVSLKGTRLAEACTIAAPLLAYCRLLLRAAERTWSHYEIQPPREHSRYHAEIAVLTAIKERRTMRAAAAPQTAAATDESTTTTASSNVGGGPFSSKEEENDLAKLDDAAAAALLQRFLCREVSGASTRTILLEIIRKLSSVIIGFRFRTKGNESKTNAAAVDAAAAGDIVNAVLSEGGGSLQQHSHSAALRHMRRAFFPLGLTDVWKTLTLWIRHASDGDAKLQSELSSPAIKNGHKSLLDNRARLARQRLRARHPPLGEGTQKLMPDEIEHCWMHDETDGAVSAHLEKLSLQILWKDSDPDAFSVDRGEPVAYVLDALPFCFGTAYDTTPSSLHASRGKKTMIFISIATGDRISTTVDSAQADTTVVRATIRGIDTLTWYKIVPMSDGLLRLQNVADNQMLSTCERGVYEHCTPSINSDDQFFTRDDFDNKNDDDGDDDSISQSYDISRVMDDEDADAHGVAERQSMRALRFRWITTIIDSPLSMNWKVFFMHHITVNSRKCAPDVTSQSCIAFHIAQLCPSQQLRDRLLGSLSFKPNRYCARRDRFFGVIVTQNKPNLESCEWNDIPDKVGPILLSAATDSEQYRELIKHFSLATTHVIVYGKTSVSDQFLKLCCEFTKKYPWRTIIFEQCNVWRNMPENRDRVVDLHEDLPARAGGCMTEFREEDRNQYKRDRIDNAEAESLLRSKRTTRWPQEIRSFVLGMGSSERHSARIVLLVGPPGTGKTMGLRNIEFEVGSHARFILFDCSGDALLQQALVTLLDNALLGIELGTEEVILVLDEYHMLSRAKKADFFRWAESKMSFIKIILIANRDDPDDEMLDLHIRKIFSANASSSASIIKRARISIFKMIEALSTVHMTGTATIQRAVTFFSTIRTLTGDDVLSLRMATETGTTPYMAANGGPPTALELLLRAKLQPENSHFVESVMRSFDSLYDEHRPPMSHDAVLKSYLQLIQQGRDPIRVLTFTAMLPVRLLDWADSDVPDATDTTVSYHPDSFLTFLEFVSATSAYRVHPAVRLTAWIRHILLAVSQQIAIFRVPDFDDILGVISKLDIVDHPSFVPIIYGQIHAAVDLNVCDTLVYPHVATLDGIYEALARHEALDWTAVQKQWVRDPITSVNDLLRIANPSIADPKKVLSHVTPQNLYGLLQREQRQDLHASSDDSGMTENSGERGGAVVVFGTSNNNNGMPLRDLILTKYPAHMAGKDASPLFWAIWQNAITQSLETSSWIALIKSGMERFIRDKGESHTRAFFSRFLMWVGSYGRSIIPFRDARERTEVCMQVITTLANEYFERPEQHVQLYRLSFIAPAVRVATLGFRRALDVALAQRPHSMWPREMKLLSRLQNRNTVLTSEEAVELFGIMGDEITSENANARVLGAMLQSSPPGLLPRRLQQQLLNSQTIVNPEDLCRDVEDETIVKNVSEELLHRMRFNHVSPYISDFFSLRGHVEAVLSKYAVLVRDALHRES
ncbi:Hypothetical protein, putative [Bodo saltans]|nr:Hypothetical protein, putative [Bodo saltans]|eukprot:CUG93877.1 Hypothetical protein, putative [Bodo saltans]